MLADPLAVDVVMRNLIENARRGGGARRAAAASRSAARRLSGEVELSVRDTGVGFRPEDGARLFEKFSRLHPGGGSSYNGTGLGLYIVRRMMELARRARQRAQRRRRGRARSFMLAWPVAPAEAR